MVSESLENYFRDVFVHPEGWLKECTECGDIFPTDASSSELKAHRESHEILERREQFVPSTEDGMTDSTPPVSESQGTSTWQSVGSSQQATTVALGVKESKERSADELATQLQKLMLRLESLKNPSRGDRIVWAVFLYLCISWLILGLDWLGRGDATLFFNGFLVACFLLGAVFYLYPANRDYNWMVLFAIFWWIPLAFWNLLYSIAGMSIPAGMLVVRDKLRLHSQSLIRQRIGNLERVLAERGLAYFRSRSRTVRVGTPSDIQKWKQEEFEAEMSSKGLVQYQGEWITPAEATIRRAETQLVASGMSKLTDLTGKEHWGRPNQVAEWRRIDQLLRENFKSITPEKFESFVGELFESMGYKVENLPDVGDYGADLKASWGDTIVIVQCKQYQEGRVGAQEVQQAIGAMSYYKADKCVLVTTSDFTVRAQNQARPPAKIELWDRKTLQGIVLQNMIGHG